MKDDVMMQDEERTLILEKEKGNVRTFLLVFDVNNICAWLCL